MILLGSGSTDNLNEVMVDNTLLTKPFVLTEQAWVPVVDLAGRQREVSLRELFAEAEQLRMIAAELPTQTFALLRLALAILHCATNGPPSEDAWRTLWRSPGLPADVDDYLEAVRERFDLFHPERPFYQVAGLRTAKDETFGIERFVADVPNGIPYLTSRSGPGMRSLSPAEAAVWLVHCQAFDPSGIKSGAVGDARVKGGRGYPIGVGSLGSLGGVYLEGTNLRETLLLNLIPVGPGCLLRADARDEPVWEREALGPAEEQVSRRGPYGVLSLYTWQSRRLKLYGDVDGVTGAMVANGDKIEWQDLHLLEPMSVWRRSSVREKAQKTVPVYVPRPHDHTRAIWRGLEALLPQTGSSSTGKEASQLLVPTVMQWAARLSRGVLGKDYVIGSRAVSAIYGTQQAVTDQLFGDSLTMNIQVVQEDSALRDVVIAAAADAEDSVKALRDLAVDLVRAAAASAENTEKGAADRSAEVAYGQLDRQFRAWLAHLDSSADPLAQRATWQKLVWRTVARCGADRIAAAGPAAWTGRTIKDVYYSSSKAEARFRTKLRQALPLAVPPRTNGKEGPA
jgi:CRISPR system Cascade subunit CasA